MCSVFIGVNHKHRQARTFSISLTFQVRSHMRSLLILHEYISLLVVNLPVPIRLFRPDTHRQ
jgi:hypothetical protein